MLGLPLMSLSPAGLLAGALPPAGARGLRSSRPTRARSTDARPSHAPPGRIARSSGRASAARRPGSSISASSARRRSRAVVVDDILDTGGTLVSCCRQLRDAGVRQIGVIATHGLFTGEHWRALLSEGVQQIWITDTVLSRRRPRQAQVVPVAPLLAPVLAGSTD